MGASPYSSLPYPSSYSPAPVGWSSTYSASSIAADALTAIQGLIQFRYRLARHFVRTDRPIGFGRGGGFYISRYRFSPVLAHDRLVRAICENTGRVFIKASLYACLHSFGPYLCLTTVRAHRSLAFEIQNLKIESINPIRFLCVFSDYLFFSRSEIDCDRCEWILLSCLHGLLPQLIIDCVCVSSSAWIATVTTAKR